MQKRIHPDAIVTLEDVRRWLLEGDEPRLTWTEDEERARTNECRKASIRSSARPSGGAPRMEREEWETHPLYDRIWRVKTRLADRYGMRCRVVTRGARNSCLVEFQADGYQVITSRNYVRKVKGAP